MGTGDEEAASTAKAAICAWRCASFAKGNYIEQKIKGIN